MTYNCQGSVKLEQKCTFKINILFLLSNSFLCWCSYCCDCDDLDVSNYFQVNHNFELIKWLVILVLYICSMGISVKLQKNILSSLPK